MFSPKVAKTQQKPKTQTQLTCPHTKQSNNKNINK